MNRKSYFMEEWADQRISNSSQRNSRHPHVDHGAFPLESFLLQNKAIQLGMLLSTKTLKIVQMPWNVYIV